MTPRISRFFSARLVVLVFPLLLVVSGCELETEAPPEPDFRPASTVVINEVFTLPLEHPAYHSWIEFYNPTGDTVNLTNWTLSQTTYRLSVFFTVRFIPTGGNPTFLGQEVVFDGLGVYDVPFAEGVQFIPGQTADTVRLPPAGLFTIVNSEARMLTLTERGPADERFFRIRGAFDDRFSSIDTLFASDTSVVIRVGFKRYSMVLFTQDQLVLKDPTGRVVDVVRYGQYTYAGPGADPYPANISLGIVPEFESIARWGGGYFTGNTANDFYITSPNARPVPHWYNARVRLK